MTHNAKPGSISAFATVFSDVVATYGRRSAHLLTQTEVRTQEMFISLLRHIDAWRRYQITVRELSNLSDRDLAELRITRLDIRRVAWVRPGRGNIEPPACGEAVATSQPSRRLAHSASQMLRIRP
ncbi:MAG TPA: DUF1127 domain-containing protein [Xanthobacteraceae bacterium]